MNKKCLVSLTIASAALSSLFLTGCGDSQKIDLSQSALPPFTGKIVEVKMRGTAQGFKFEPSEIAIQRGDKLRFTMVEGGPHNVNFTNQRVPGNAAIVLQNRGKLVGALMQAPGQAYEIEFTQDMPIGEYDFVCDPHAALGMKGKVYLN